MTLTEHNSIDYLQLTLTTGIGPRTLETLLARFVTASEVLQASPQALAEVEGVGVTLSRRIRSSEFRDSALSVFSLCEDKEVRILFPWEQEFPRLLKELPDPPMLLYVRGEFARTDALSVAVVGTRGATLYGRSQAERFSRALARGGLTIVSGLARGIDAAAHQGALEVGGRTIAVLSSGVTEIYPPQHTELGERIAAHGALISEMPPGSKPKKGMFPQRNRLISGLSLGTIVIEAAERSRRGWQVNKAAKCSLCRDWSLRRSRVVVID